MNLAGIGFALIALFSFGFGDFFIQRSSRKIGIFKTLFFIGLVGLIILFPFIVNNIGELLQLKIIWLFGLTVVITFFAALFNFEALKEGKIAIIEPIIGLELPLTVALSVVLLGENLSPSELFLIAIVFIGIILATTIHFSHLHYHKRIFERGVIFAGLGAIGMALTNFLVGISSQQTNPLITIWVVHASLAIVCFSYLIIKSEAKFLISDLKNNFGIISGASILDNLAWVVYGFSMTLIPISISTTVVEAYIALAVFLGIFISREKIKPHQVLGLILVLGGILLLSLISN